MVCEEGALSPEIVPGFLSLENTGGESSLGISSGGVFVRRKSLAKGVIEDCARARALPGFEVSIFTAEA